MCVCVFVAHIIIMFACLSVYVQFAEHHDITHFYEVSAKTGENVTESFEAFFRELHRKVSHTIIITSIFSIIVRLLSCG